MAIYRLTSKTLRRVSWVDLALFSGLVLFIYCLIGAVHQWSAPFRPKTEIDLSLVSLLGYSVLSLVRVVSAYLLSLAFTFVYGYAAARSRFGEPVLIPLLDILQSVPVLGFMPGLVLALIRLFPNSNIGLELAAVVMIFTGQGWNMVFSFYSSLKAIPEDLQNVSRVYRLNRFDTLRRIEIPFAMNGLLWNSMLSMAGGWFFLMVIESFSLGDRDFRLPGIGSYMAVAYEQGDVGAIVAGMLVMAFLIFLVDRVVWAPIVVWSEKYKYQETHYGVQPRSFVLDWLKRSDLLSAYFELRDDLAKRLRKRFEKPAKERAKRPTLSDPALDKLVKVLRYAVVGFGFVGVIFGLYSMFYLVTGTPATSWLIHSRDTLFTFLRVMVATILGSLWAIPAGVFIGTNPRWTRRLQPVVQIVASFPAPMLFPLLTLFMARLGVSMEVGAIVLMVFASQWYILFNVISGATLIPRPMMEMAEVFQLRGREYWKAVIMPCIFPSLVNGWITAAGGAWNASIVSEWVKVGQSEYTATGIGASITRAAQVGDYHSLAAGVLVMVTTVVLLNRLLWGSLYRLAETRFRMES